MAGYQPHQTPCTLLPAPRPVILFDPGGEGVTDAYDEIFCIYFHQVFSSKRWMGERSPQTKISALGLDGPLHGTFWLMQHFVAELTVWTTLESKGFISGTGAF